MHEDAIAVLEAELHALRTKAAAVEAAIAALRGGAPRTLTPIAPLATDGAPTDRSWESVAARIEHAQRARGWSQREEWAAWCLARDRAMVRAASRAHAEGRAVQVLALVAPWSPTHGTEYTAAEARRLGLEVVVRRYGEG